MAQSETVERILDAAEQLFAEKGFAETSLRLITSKAGVNLAAVNYHFGSKKSLIHAVFAGFLTPFTARLRSELSLYEESLADEPAELRYLLGIVFNTALLTCADQPERLNRFMRLLGLAYTQGQGHIKRYLNREYGEDFASFSDLLRRSMPELSAEELYWRFHFMLGAVMFTFSGVDTLKAMAEHDVGRLAQTSDVIDLLLPFVAGGMQVPAQLPVAFAGREVSGAS